MEPERVSDSHVWLFPGSNREHRWIELVRQAYDSEESEVEGDAVTRATEGGLQVPTGESGSGSRSRERSPEAEVEGEKEEKKPRFE